MAENELPPTPEDGIEKPKPKVSFSEEQQEFIQKLIDKAQGSVYDKTTPVIESLKQQVTDLTAKLNAKPDPEPTPKPKPESKPEPKPEPKLGPKPDDAFAALNAQMQELRTLAETLKTEKQAAEKRAEDAKRANRETTIKEHFIRAAEKIDFFDRMEVFDLIKGQLELGDAGQVIVMNLAANAPRMNTNLEPMSLSEFLVEYAKEKPWKVRAKNPEGGTGSAESRRLDIPKSQSAVPDVSKLSLDEVLALSNEVIAKQYDR